MTGAQYLYVEFSRRNKIPSCSAYDILDLFLVTDIQTDKRTRANAFTSPFVGGKNDRGKVAIRPEHVRRRIEVKVCMPGGLQCIVLYIKFY